MAVRPESPMRTTTAPDGRRIAFDVHGSVDGSPVLYLHGVPSSRLETQFFGLAVAAREAAVQLVAIDRAGIGGTEPRSGGTLHDTAVDVAAVADALGHARFALLGYSAGSPSALATAAALPGRVSALAVVSGIAPADRADLTATQAEEVARMFRWAREGSPMLPLMLRLMALGTRSPNMLIKAAGKGAPPADLAVLRRPSARSDFVAFLSEAFRQGTAGVRTDFHQAAGRWHFDPASIVAPVHIWHGDQDRNSPVAAAHWLHEQCPQSRLEIGIEDGHASLIATRGREILAALVHDDAGPPCSPAAAPDQW